MLSKDKVDAFWEARADIADKRIATHYKKDGAIDYDVELVKQYLTPEAEVCDLGAGTGCMTEMLAPQVKKIVAVEKVKSLLDRVEPLANIEPVCSDIMDFDPHAKFDVVLLFGVINFLAVADEEVLYKKIYRYLKPGGILIANHACGVAAEVIVDKYSEQIGAHYNCRYPFLESEKALLEQNFEVKVVDIYPKELNRWENTHYYAFVAQKK